VRSKDDLANRSWDSEKALRAANALRATMPKQLQHWDSLRWAPETAGGSEAMKLLSESLEEALPYIEWPYGRYERKKKLSKPPEWHVAAVIIANKIVEATGQSIQTVSLSRKSPLPKVVSKALREVEFGEREVSAVSMCLERWREEYVVRPMTTNPPP
jgi:hypothetical protein